MLAFHGRSFAVVCGAVLVCAGCATTAGGPKTRSAPVEFMASESAPARWVPGAEARLTTSPDGATLTMSTAGLNPGHVTTAWWVFMARPDKCQSSPCSAEDVIGRADLVGTQIVYADGVVTAPDGTAAFTAHLPRGPVTGGWYDQAFDNPMQAEIHLVLNDHGPLLPDIAASMLTSYRGGCRDDSLPPPFPASAKADGAPGPNACQLIQDAIFQQGDRL